MFHVITHKTNYTNKALADAHLVCDAARRNLAKVEQLNGYVLTRSPNTRRPDVQLFFLQWMSGT